MKLIKKLVLLATIGVFVFGMTTTVFADDPPAPPQKVRLILDPGGGTFEGLAPGVCKVMEFDYEQGGVYIEPNYLESPTKEGYEFWAWVEEGKNYGFNYLFLFSDTTVYAHWDKIYNVISGENQTFYTESSNDISVTIDGDINNFDRVLFSKQNEDGSYTPYDEFSDDDYVVTEGSTVVTLKNSFLKTLQPGVYEIYVSFVDGAYGVDFTVAEGADPNAPEENPTLPVEPTVAADSDASESTTPKTGDNSNMAVCVSIAMAAAAGIVTVAVFKKKSNA